MVRLTLALPLAGALALAPLEASSQAVRVPDRDPRVRAALQMLQAQNEWTLGQQVAICEIPAPPFKEAERAQDYARRLREAGVPRVSIDEEGNVIGERPGAGRGPSVVLSGHLDTVFPEGTDVTVRRTGTRFDGPGIGDDCRGLAVVLAVARALNEAKVVTDGTIYFVGTVGEEGAGNLRGVRHLMETSLKGRVNYFFSVDGTGLGVTSGAVGSHRYRVSYEGPGGHSYGDFGVPNPIHALGRAISHISELRVPAQPKTTFSVGVIGGGTSVNSISQSAHMDIDMRSVSKPALDSLDAAARAALQRALDEEHARWPGSDVRLRVRIDTIGIRPAGTQPDTALIVRTARAAGTALGFDTGAPTASSTDANVPIAMGIPALTVDGGGSGGGAHSLTEWYDDGERGWLGPQWAALIVTALTGVRR